MENIKDFLNPKYIGLICCSLVFCGVGGYLLSSQKPGKDDEGNDVGSIDLYAVGAAMICFGVLLIVYLIITVILKPIVKNDTSMANAARRKNMALGVVSGLMCTILGIWTMVRERNTDEEGKKLDYHVYSIGAVLTSIGVFTLVASALNYSDAGKWIKDKAQKISKDVSEYKNKKVQGAKESIENTANSIKNKTNSIKNKNDKFWADRENANIQNQIDRIIKDQIIHVKDQKRMKDVKEVIKYLMEDGKKTYLEELRGDIPKAYHQYFDNIIKDKNSMLDIYNQTHRVDDFMKRTSDITSRINRLNNLNKLKTGRDQRVNDRSRNIRSRSNAVLDDLPQNINTDSNAQLQGNQQRIPIDVEGGPNLIDENVVSNRRNLRNRKQFDNDDKYDGLSDMFDENGGRNRSGIQQGGGSNKFFNIQFTNPPIIF